MNGLWILEWSSCQVWLTPSSLLPHRNGSLTNFLFNSFLVTTINFSQFLLYYVILKINIVKICFFTRSIKILRIVLSVTGSLYSTVHILKKHTDNANYKWISIINSMEKVFVGLSWFFFLISQKRERIQKSKKPYCLTLRHQRRFMVIYIKLWRFFPTKEKSEKS